MVEKKLKSEKVEAISTKALIKNLINGFKIAIGVSYFSSRKIQNYLVFKTAKKYFRVFRSTFEIYSRKSNGMSEKVLKIKIRKTATWLEIQLIFLYYHM